MTGSPSVTGEPSAPDSGGASVPGSAGTASESSPATGSGIAAPVPSSLLGYIYTAKSATGRTLVDGKPPTITFSAPNQVGLNAGCNGMGGVPVFDGATFKVERIISTMMACTNDGVMDQEHWFSTWLTAGVSWKDDGSYLVLSGDGVTVTFERTGKAPARSPGPGAGRPTSTTVPSIPKEHPPITAPTGTAVGPITPIPVTPPARPRNGGNSVAPPPTTPDK